MVKSVKKRKSSAKQPSDNPPDTTDKTPEDLFDEQNAPELNGDNGPSEDPKPVDSDHPGSQSVPENDIDPLPEPTKAKKVKKSRKAFVDEPEENIVEFHEMGLDDRILKAIGRLGWSIPTLIQEKAIPLALDGKDILARARTGTGKTAAFAIPIIHQLLALKETLTGQGSSRNTLNDSGTIPRALVLVPSRELAAQITQAFNDLMAFCGRELRVMDLAQSNSPAELRPLLIAERPDILIGTPSRVLAHLDAKNLPPTMRTALQYLVIDEADLMFTFGYEKDIERIFQEFSISGGVCQSFLMSATFNPDVTLLKKLALHNPVILKLEEPNLPETDQLVQYHIQCEEEEKFTLINALFKLHLILGRTIIFVNDVDRCYKLKLFLEQFAIHACILNPELPIKSRCYIVQQFNSGKYDIIIACDEKCLENPLNRKQKKRRQLMGKRDFTDREFGASRGIDFHQVSNVINFDFPMTVTAYVHRVGRAARGLSRDLARGGGGGGSGSDPEGTVLSFISIAEQDRFEQVKKSFARKQASQGHVVVPDSDDPAGGISQFKPYAFRMEELEAFRYRSKDAMRAVTAVAIREARIKEIKREMLTSQRLAGFFESHPKDKRLLVHDKSLFTVKHQPHLKHVPEYIVPPSLQVSIKSGGGGGMRREQKRQAAIEEAASLSFPNAHKRRGKSIKRQLNGGNLSLTNSAGGGGRGGKGSGSGGGKTKLDPLKTLRMKITKPKRKAKSKKMRKK